VTADQQELLDALWDLYERLPVPGSSWHAHAALIAGTRTDFKRALDGCAHHPKVLDLIGRALDGELDAALAPNANAELTAAYERFRTLPIPAGEHPFLDEILPTLEAVEATLVCLSLDPDAARRFAAKKRALRA
jgi:hypothetical protein